MEGARSCQMGSAAEAPSRARAQDDDEDEACCSRDCRRRLGCRLPLPCGRSVKRKLEGAAARGCLPGANVAARVEVGDEAAALREALASHRQTVSELWTELEEERAASASAATETMSMILRLQREKAEVQMEARQFRRFAEEKMAHDQQELVALDNLLCNREQALRALSCDLRACRRRLLSFGIPVDALDLSNASAYAKLPASDCAAAATISSLALDYPQLRCHSDLEIDDDEAGDLDLCRRHLQSRSNFGTFNSPFAGNWKQGEESPASSGRQSTDDDGIVDRVCTVDAVHQGAAAATQVPTDSPCEYASTPTEAERYVGGGGGEEAELRKLHMRLEALETDRESMREALASMRTDKARLVLLKEISQQLYGDASSSPAPVSVNMLVKRPPPPPPPPPVRISFISLIRWVFSLVFRKGNTHRSNRSLDLSSNKMGLLLILERAPHARRWRCLSRTHRLEP